MKSRLAPNHNPSPVTKPTEAGFWIHERADDMPHLPVARFTRRPGEDAIFAFACRIPRGRQHRGRLRQPGRRRDVVAYRTF